MLPNATDPPLIILFNHTAGDTWIGIPTIGPIKVKGPDDEEAHAPGVDLASATLSFTLEGSTLPAITYNTAPGSASLLTLVSGPMWELSLLSQAPAAFTLVPGKYIGRLRITDATGIVRTTHRYSLIITDPNSPACA